MPINAHLKQCKEKKRKLVHIKLCTKDIQIARRSKRRKEFEEACIDTGAEQCVIGKTQAMLYCKKHEVPFKLRQSDTRFRFGDGSYDSLGKIIIKIPTPNGSTLVRKMDVVQADIPLLIGLDLLHEEKLVADNVRNKLVNTVSNWEMPITRKFGHLYLCWSKSILFTKSELIRLHRHFYHPFPDRLMGLIKKSSPEQADQNTRRILKEISEACSTCQKYSRPPERFKVSLPNDEIIFNHTLALDLMWLNSKAVLHVVDTQTHFSSAAFLRGQTVEDVWDAFMFCWVTQYTGFPVKIKTDQGSCFTSLRWTSRTNAVGTEMETSGVESHNSLGPGERYHEPLRKVFKNIMDEQPDMRNEHALRLAIKACNDTLGPEGLVPSYLVFGCIPRFPSVDSSLTKQKERMQAM